ncbi:putative 3-hydroxybutyryl-CoA dehydrogenase, partial [Bienertia sinuspersici]
VIDMHFMNPPPIMKLVETIRGAATSVCFKDYSGFIVNRILMSMINEVFSTLYTRVATKEESDAGMKLGTNQPMGPLQLADFISLDVCLLILRVLHADLRDVKYDPFPLYQYVDAGHCGRKPGVGIYDYRQVSKSTKQAARL